MPAALPGSVTGVVSEPGSMMRVRPPESRRRAACSSFVTFMARANTPAGRACKSLAPDGMCVRHARDDGRMQRRLRLLVAVNPAASFGRRTRTGALVLDRLRAAGHDAEALQRPSMAELHDAVAASIAARRPD